MMNVITVAERVRRCLLLEKMDANKAYSKELGLENKSSFFKNNRCNSIKPDRTGEEEDITYKHK